MRYQHIGYSAEDVRRIYEDTSSGHWFSQPATRFFGTKLTANFRLLDDRTAAFITTEQPPHGARMATVRVARLLDYVREDGMVCQKVTVTTYGEFCFMTLARAKTVLRDLTLEALKGVA